MTATIPSGLRRAALLASIGMIVGCEFATAVDRDDIDGDPAATTGGQGNAGGAGGQGGQGGQGGGGGGAPEPVGEALWGRGAGALGEERVEGIAALPDGGAMLVGGFQTTITWGGGDDLLTSAGGQDVMLVKLGPQGEHVWSKRFGDDLHQYATAVAVDPGGDIVVVGELEGTLSLGEDPAAALVSAGGRDLFVARFDAQGNHLWSRRFGDALDQYATAVALTEHGDIAVVGMFEGTVNFGDDPGAALTSEGAASAAIALLDAQGSHLWSRSIGGPESWQRFRSVALDAGGLYLSGAFTGALILDDMEVVSSVDGWTPGGTGGSGGSGGQGGSGGGAPIYGPDGLVLKLEPDTGKVAWARQVGAAGEQYAKLVSVGADGNPVVLGNYLAAFEIGSTPIPHEDGGGYNLYLAKLDAGTGEPLAARGFPAEGDQFVWGLNQDPWGNHVLGGYFTAALDLGGAQPPIQITDGSEGDAFVAKLSEDFSAELWADVYRDSQYSYVSAQAIRSDGGALAAGLFHGDALDLGGGTPPIAHSEQAVPGANGDIFLVSVSP